MMTYLQVITGLAFVLTILALLVGFRRHVDHTEHGRALLFALGAVAILAVVGVGRRLGLDLEPYDAAFAWTVVAAVATWVLTSSRTAP